MHVIIASDIEQPEWPLPAPTWAKEVEYGLKQNGQISAQWRSVAHDAEDIFLSREDILTELGVLLGQLEVCMWSAGDCYIFPVSSAEAIHAMGTALLELARFAGGMPAGQLAGDLPG